MPLLDASLDRITEQDIRGLLEAATPESAVLDYKRDAYSDTIEFCKDVSSFANGRGGDIVIGLEEHGGVPIEIVPFMGDADQEILRLEQMARTGLDPRLPRLNLRAVPIASGGSVLIVRVSASFIGPHRVIAKGGNNRFWLRSSAGKFEPDVSELRRLFVEGPHLVEKIRDFTAMRVGKISAGETAVPMNLDGKLVTHVVSLPAFADNRLIDIMELIAKGTHMPLPPKGMGIANNRLVNLDGFVNFVHDGVNSNHSYAQLFRKGAIEGVLTLPFVTSSPAYHGLALANWIVGTIKQHVAVLRSYDAGSPIYAFISLCGIKGAKLLYSASDLPGSQYASTAFSRDQINLPEVMLDDSLTDIPQRLKVVMTMLWNAFGLDKCEAYDAEGVWIGSTNS